MNSWRRQSFMTIFDNANHSGHCSHTCFITHPIGSMCILTAIEIEAINLSNYRNWTTVPSVISPLIMEKSFNLPSRILKAAHFDANYWLKFWTRNLQMCKCLDSRAWNFRIVVIYFVSMQIVEHQPQLFLHTFHFFSEHIIFHSFLS